MNAPLVGAQIAAFVLAGRAVFTLANPTTGNRYTFRVSRRDETSPHFVSVLTGADNVSDYTYLGCIFADGRFVVTRKSRISPDAPSARAFTWFWARVHARRSVAPAEVWHEGRCGRCCRPLTDPASIASGLGPVCGGRS